MAERIRQFFDDVQMAAESGGRQHDKSGKPLVGRYRDGTTPAPDKRAYGAGQMQIGTAKETAQRYGIAWDENRFLNDKDYNLDLADRHMQFLTQKYGDKTLARAAYHSGTGTVDKAIKKYGREGFAQGLGPEGRNYIKMGGTYNSSSPGRGVADPAKFLEGLESTLAPQKAASQNVSSSADMIFNSDSEMARRGQAVESELQNQSAAIGVLDSATQALQATQVNAMQTQVEETRAVSDEITRGTNELKEKVKPIIAARAAVANQLDRLASMNPLERGLRGMFDLNYDRKYLESQLKHFETTMEARAQDYDYLNKLHNIALGEVDRRFKMETAIPGLMAEQAKEDLGIVGIRLQQTAASLGNLSDMVKTQSQLISAKAAAREDMLSRLDLPTLSQLHAQAETNGGVVEHGGVQLSGNELYERIQAKEHQDLNMESVRMAIASNRMDMAEKYAVNIARSLTREQVEGAIANGGVYQGVQLPQDVLTTTLNSHLVRANQMAETAANTLPANQALKVGVDALRMTTGIYQRTKTMYGQADQGTAAQIMNNGTMAIQALTEAVKGGQPPEVIAALTKKVAETTKQMESHTEGVLLRQAGGDKRAAGYLKGFVYGTPLSQGAAVEALSYFALKGNLPTGLQMSPESKTIFKEAQRIVGELRLQRDPRTGKPYTESAIAAKAATQLAETAPKVVGEARFMSLYNDLPAAAKLANHPLGRLPMSAWTQARTRSELTAAETVAAATGISRDELLTMYRTKKPLNDSQAAKDKYAKFQEKAGLWNEQEQRTLTIELDQLDPVTPGRRNSSVLLDYMTSSDAAGIIKQYTQARGANSLGDYLANPLAAGATESAFAETATSFQDARDGEYNLRRQVARTQPAGMLMQPVNRSMVILGSMPGVTQNGAAKLRPYIQEILKPYLNSGQVGGVSVNAQMRDQDAAVYEGLKQLKFDDPAMETIRKNAVAAWPQHSTQAKGVIESLVETVSQFFDLDGM